jgi:glycosyltransferase involved in cell wall biosynthesis
VRVLHINKFAYPKGGAENYMLRTAARQSDRGHEVAVLGADPDPSALPGSVRTFGLTVPDYHDLGGVAKLRAAKDVLWSKPAAKVVESAIQEFAPDIVHLHNYAHQLSSSILSVITSHKTPTIYTAHDYKLVCPAYVANVDDKDCFSCAFKLSTKLIRARCHHDSLTWSGVVGLEAMLVRARRLVPDVIIGPSEFMADALRSSWIGDLSDIRMVRNPVEAGSLQWTGSQDYLLYVGRLSREKGVDALLSAAAVLNIPLKVAGDGPLREELERQAVALDSKVDFLGHVGQEDLSVLRQQCRAQVISSAWPENAPLSALEAAADGVPLVVTARGGLPEFVKFGARVVVVNELGVKDLATALEKLESIQGDLDNFRRATSWENHLSALDSIYSESLLGAES